MPTVTREQLAEVVIREVARRAAEVAARTPPPKWQAWAALLHDEEVRHGPRYSPGWFGGLADTEARRVRVLRTVYRLADAGLLHVVKSEGGRLAHVRLTDDGATAAAELAAG